jgi:DNA-binding NarL/FixJ family response regulator
MGRQVAIVGATKPYRVGLGAALEAAGFDVVEGDGSPAWVMDSGLAAVVVMLGGGDWSLLAAYVEVEGVVVVALVPDNSLGGYKQALVDGADGVVIADTSPELIVHVLEAALAGEVVLPVEAGRRLARLAAGLPAGTDRLGPEEVMILAQLAGGASTREMAEALYVSDRTLRRRLQSIYLKLGVASRSQAIAEAGRRGLLKGPN